jgi:hypothetical protein
MDSKFLYIIVPQTICNLLFQLSISRLDHVCSCVAKVYGAVGPNSHYFLIQWAQNSILHIFNKIWKLYTHLSEHKDKIHMYVFIEFESSIFFQASLIFLNTSLSLSLSLSCKRDFYNVLIFIYLFSFSMSIIKKCVCL